MNTTKKVVSKLFIIEGTDWRVGRDQYGNYRAEQYREVDKKVGGKVMEWIKLNSYHPNLGCALEEIIDKELYTGMPPSTPIVEALAAYKEVTTIILAGCEKSKGWV